MSALYSPTAPQRPPLNVYPPHDIEMPLTSNIKNTVNHRNQQARPLPAIPQAIRLSSPQRSSLPDSNAAAPDLNHNHNRAPQNTSRPRVLSSFLPWAPRNMNTTLLGTLSIPPVLGALLAHLDWADVYPLFATSKGFRDLFTASIPLRDVVLTRYVPGYAHALRLRSRDASMNHHQDVQVSVRDLDLLLLSQRVPLHRYPTHALRTLTSLYPTFEDDETTAKLVALTQAHSRFVLLIQSLVHSSSAPFPPEQDFREVKPKFRSRFEPVHKDNFNLRELTFPAPLAYTQLPAHSSASPGPRQGTPRSTSTATRHRTIAKHSRHTSTNGEFALNAPVNPHLKIDHGPRPSANSLSSMISSSNLQQSNTLRKRRLSIFGPGNRPSPPPPEEPKTLRVYSSNWRRKSFSVGVNGHRNVLSHERGYASEADEQGHWQGLGFGDDLNLTRPTRRFASADASSDSSLSGSAPPSIEGRDSPPAFLSAPGFTSTHVHGAHSPLSPPTLTSSPHDLIHATTRTRAPILRVFVPCTKLEEDDDGSSAIILCERQLEEAGLWSHLSTGDVVCNLGYVPTENGDEDGEGGDMAMGLGFGGGGILRSRTSASFSHRGTPSSTSSGSGSGSNRSSGFGPGPSAAQRKWLLFNGHFLVPYAPPSPLPLDSSPLSLPSPFYYAHITPPNSGNPTFAINRLPVCDDVPQLTLVHAESKVPSPHSPRGWAVVRRWAWIARVVRLKPPPLSGDAEEEIGEGWYGEWFLEYEGTREGKQTLLDALAGRQLGRRRWELVKEKSGAGRVWLRLLP